jgi:hypothetical protein
MGVIMKLFKQIASIGAIAVLIITYAASIAQAAELYLLGGEAFASHPTAATYSWQLEYRQDLLKHLAAGVSYLNEGHVGLHHRDGYTAQLWERAELLDYRLTLAAGAGAYFFLDTTKSSSPDGFSDNHGLKGMFSLAAAFRLENNMLLEFRSNLVKGGSGYGTASILAGLGYHFDQDLEPMKTAEAAQYLEPKNEITLFLGQTIVNSFDSQRSIAASVEYRRHLLRHLDWTVAGIYEGDNRLIRRDGVITEFWAVQPLMEDTMTVGVGAGAYFDISHYNNPFDNSDSDRFASGIITLTSSYRFTPHWALRASWNRVVTTYHRDTDVFLGGLGYSF